MCTVTGVQAKETFTLSLSINGPSSSSANLKEQMAELFQIICASLGSENYLNDV